MKYKKNIGGADIAIPQPNKPSSNSPTISDSVKGTFNSFKDFYTSSILFIKTNFIFCLLVGVLLIVYTALFFSDTLTKEKLDKQNEIAKVKCDSYTTPCPTGKKRVDTKDCVDNVCDEATCCINDVNCSTYTNTCPDNKTVKTDNKCTTETCTAEDCCSVNCSSFNTPCPTGKINNPLNICAGDTCTSDECCVDKYTCLNGSNSQPYDCGVHNRVLKSNPTTILCPLSVTGDGCNETICCDPMPSKCNTYDGCVNNGLRNNASNISCPVTGCDIATCCNASDSGNSGSGNSDSGNSSSGNSGSVMCNTYTSCPNNYSLITDSATKQCLSAGCDTATCCQQN